MVFIYVPSPVKAVQGAFEVKEVLSGSPGSIWRRFGAQTGISKKEFHAYYKGKEKACAILISRCWKFRRPVRLEKLKKNTKGFRPPQSYHYKCPVTFSRSVGFSLPKKLAA